MSKRWILAGSTDQTIDVFIQDSSSTTGAGLTGLTSATSGLTCYYRKGATGTPTALTLASQTVTGAHTDGGFVAVDGTNMPGVYRLDLSDTIVASAGMVTLFLRGAANMAQLPLEIEVVSVNPYDSAAFGLSRLDAAISSRMATYTQPTGFLAATFPTTVASPTNITAGTITTVSGNVSGNVVGSVGSVTGAVGSVTGNVGGSVASVTGNVGGNVVGSVASVTARVTANTDQLAGQTVTAANAVVFPSTVSSLTAAGVRSELQVELGRIDVDISSRLATSGYTTPPTSGAIADAVWDEATAGHTTAGTFGKLMDTLRKANYVTEGSVAAGGTPTTTSFRTDLTAANDTYDNQTLLFLTGVLAGESVPILTYAQSNGLITTQNALTAAPTAADEFVILPDHVHSVAEIADGVHDEAVEGAETLRQAVRLMRAALVGKLSGAATTTVTIRDAGDTKARITATVDADGNRSAVTTDAT